MERLAALARLIAGKPAWGAVLDQARFHGILPLLHVALKDHTDNRAIPGSVWQSIEMGAALTSLKNASLTHALADSLTALHAHGITPLVLKGPALAATLYPDLGVRPFSDLDLLCPHEQLTEADMVLRALGYRPAAQKPWEQDDFHVVYGSAGGATTIELHSDLLQLGLPTRCLTDLWRDSATISIGGTAARTLGLEHLLLHLCVHVHTHGYCRLIWFKDLDLLLRARGSEVSWDRLWGLARDEGVLLSVRHALTLTRSLLLTPLPQGATRGPRPSATGEVAHALLWPRQHVLQLKSKQRLRSLRFNPRLGVGGCLPSLVVMGRRREKLARLSQHARNRLVLSRTRSGGRASAPAIETQPLHNANAILRPDNHAEGVASPRWESLHRGDDDPYDDCC